MLGTAIANVHGGIRQQLANNEMTEERFVDILAARGISLLEANEMSDPKLVAMLLDSQLRDEVFSTGISEANEAILNAMIG